MDSRGVCVQLPFRPDESSAQAVRQGQQVPSESTIVGTGEDCNILD